MAGVVSRCPDEDPSSGGTDEAPVLEAENPRRAHGVGDLLGRLAITHSLGVAQNAGGQAHGMLRGVGRTRADESLQPLRDVRVTLRVRSDELSLIHISETTRRSTH